MKLAEALLLRADLQKRIEQIEGRLLRNAKVQEGETPAEDPQALLAELSDLVRQLETLMRRINETNAALTDAGETMTALLARRDCLRLYVQALRRFCAEASETVMRGTRSEVVVRSAVDVRRLQKTIAIHQKSFVSLISASRA